MATRSKAEFKDEEFDNFVHRVEEIDALIRGMLSKDERVSGLAIQKADDMLNESEGSPTEGAEVEKTEPKKCGFDRTVINQLPPQPSQSGGGDTMSPEAFMKFVEKDAAERKRDKDERKAVADRLKKEGNNYFHQGDFNKALNCYNKAIDEIKDSPLLYTNRALTYIRLELYFRGLADCETALKCRPGHLRAHLLKARCLYALGEDQEAKRTIDEAVEYHPHRKSFIEEYLVNKELAKTESDEQTME